MTEKKHVIKRSVVDVGWWYCSCGRRVPTQDAAERHAFDNRGVIEMGRAS